jgi:alpha-glucosidase
LPWTHTGPSFGFGPGGAWLPQPPWFAAHSVQTQLGEPDSTLNLYRRALVLRRALHADDMTVDWIDTGDPELLHFARRNGWQAVVNFSKEPRPLPTGRLVLSSRRLVDTHLPGETTVWTVRP